MFTKNIRLAMRAIAILTLSITSAASYAAGGCTNCIEAKINPKNYVALQRGAQAYMNYCLGCHSLEYQRYEGFIKDFKMDESIVKDNLMFTSDKVGDLIKIAMPANKSEAWFGVTPPDLTLVVRSHGADWLYSYLKSFYKDDSRPYGVNNLVYKDVGMPHVLASLQGMQARVNPDSDRIEDLVLVEPGELDAEAFDTMILDLVTFLDYVAEPKKLERQRIGAWVLFFLVIFFFVTYFLKKEYWKDVH